MVLINIHVFPDDETFYYSFDEKKSFKDLKNDLKERQKVEEVEYYIEMNDNIMDDNMILKDNGVKDYSDIFVMRNDYIRINMEIKDIDGKISTVLHYISMSDFNIIKANENKEVKVCGKIILTNFFLFFFL